ncbi:ethylene-responsive transcription factor WIN1-like [Hibiscus syriacus]|uniref:Ethylene-responsive transcription factor WIN1-like n=1 Tax=Hibiscus syriacus TaxID=106335 RepID=A0A6A2YTQ2_HIBSY|nr:ethylene-responsive transcription factor WIN1-like [Hibiscus syriacus]
MITTWVTDLLNYMCNLIAYELKGSRCFGCCTKPTPIIAVDQPSKGLRIRGRIVRKPSISDDFWSSSTYELENSALQSQRSLLSISASNQILSQCSSISGMVISSDFVLLSGISPDSNGLGAVGKGIILNKVESLD